MGHRGDGGTTIRPRRPCGRSRADHAVTASRSRSMRYWSGTSTASAGTNRAASVASEQQQRSRPLAASACDERGRAGDQEQPDADDDPDPQRLVALHVERAGDRGRDRGDQARSRRRSSAAARAPAPRPPRTPRPRRTPARPPSGARSAGRAAARRGAPRSASSADRELPWSVSRPPTREPNQPASTATPTATVNQATENGPGRAVVPGARRDVVARGRRTAPAGGQHVAAADAELGQRGRRAGSSLPSRLCSGARTGGRPWAAYSRATSSTDASGGTTRSSDAGGAVHGERDVPCAGRRRHACHRRHRLHRPEPAATSPGRLVPRVGHTYHRTTGSGNRSAVTTTDRPVPPRRAGRRTHPGAVGHRSSQTPARPTTLRGGRVDEPEMPTASSSCSRRPRSSRPRAPAAC